MNRRPVRYVTFLHVATLDQYLPLKEQDLSNQYKRTSIKLVHAYELRTAHKPMDRVMCCIPAVAERPHNPDAWPGWPRFSFGVYYARKDLLLLSDVEDWAHHHIEFDEIRTAAERIRV